MIDFDLILTIVFMRKLFLHSGLRWMGACVFGHMFIGTCLACHIEQLNGMYQEPNRLLDEAEGGGEKRVKNGA